MPADTTLIKSNIFDISHKTLKFLYYISFFRFFFSVTIQIRQLNSLLKILSTNEHTVCNLFGLVCWFLFQTASLLFDVIVHTFYWLHWVCVHICICSYHQTRPFLVSLPCTIFLGFEQNYSIPNIRLLFFSQMSYIQQMYYVWKWFCISFILNS